MTVPETHATAPQGELEPSPQKVALLYKLNDLKRRDEAPALIITASKMYQIRTQYKKLKLSSETLAE